jgi:hypothetical protein
MEFSHSPKSDEVSAKMADFMRDEIIPAESEYESWRAVNDPRVSTCT